MKAIILLLLLFFFVRFVLRFVLPVVRVMRATRRGMQQMQEGFNSQAPHQPVKPASFRPSPSKNGDYIDYEEVR